MSTNESTECRPKEKINMISAFAYSAGYSASNIIWYMINNYLLLFYTDIVGLAAGAISMIMLVARIWAAVCDPVMGAIVDRTHSKWGKFKPYLAFGAPFLAIFNLLTFTVWPIEGVKKVFICLICYLIFGSIYASVTVAINGIVNRLANDSQIKMDIIAVAQVISSIVQTILGACTMPLILWFSKSDVANGTGYFWTTAIFSVVSVILLWGCVVGCKEVKTHLQEEKNIPKMSKVPVKQSLLALVKNKMLLISILNVFIGTIGAMLHMSLLTYYLIYCVGAYAYIAPVFTINSFAQILGTLVIPFTTRKFGKKRWMVFSLLINATSMLVLFLIPTANIVTVVICTAVYGFTNSVTSICSSMICDSIEYGDYKYGVRDDAFAFSFMGLGAKIATAVVGSAGVLLLALVGYTAGVEQSEETLRGINVIVNLAPAIIGYIALIPLLFYKLDEKTMEEIRIELDERRAKI